MEISYVVVKINLFQKQVLFEIKYIFLKQKSKVNSLMLFYEKKNSNIRK